MESRNFESQVNVQQKMRMERLYNACYVLYIKLCFVNIKMVKTTPGSQNILFLKKKKKKEPVSAYYLFPSDFILEDIFSVLRIFIQETLRTLVGLYIGANVCTQLDFGS